MQSMTKTLEWVNTVRSQHELPTIAELPRGIPNTSDHCVIARALTGTNESGTLTARVGDHFAHYYGDAGHRVAHAHMPWGVQAFIKAFDRGEIPELIA